MGLINMLLPVVEREIRAYREAEEALRVTAEVQGTINEEFAPELELIAGIQERMQARQQELLANRGVEQPVKVYEQMQKDVRKALFAPVTAILVEDLVKTGSKTYVRDDATLTLVTQKPVLVANHVLGDAAQQQKAHQRDVQLLITNEMYSSLQIMPDQNTMAWMQLRELNALPSLQSVVVEEQGYCKVKLHGESL